MGGRCRVRSLPGRRIPGKTCFWCHLFPRLSLSSSQPPVRGPWTLGTPPSVLPHSAVPTVPAVHGGGVLWPCRAARTSLQQDPLLPGPVSASLETAPSSVQYVQPPTLPQFHCPCPDGLKRGFPLAMKKAGHEQGPGIRKVAKNPTCCPEMRD